MGAMVALKENSANEVVDVDAEVVSYGCRNHGCKGKVAISEANSVPFSDCACLKEVFPCDVCGLLHVADGRHLHKRDKEDVGVFRRNGRIVCRKLNKE
jgi:hypothetical protein